ncbi:MAG: class I SAM-dependent methyltransferase [Clostridiales bacterium]|nr:class I SAM-dependent methyltransferase [Clostridiales bacterium]
MNNFKSSKDLSCDLNSFDTYTYTHDTQNAVEECISIVNEALMNTPSGSLVLDFAAGHGNLFSRIQKRVDLTYIVNDIDFNSLLHIKRLSHDNNIDINYFAYDAGHSPFNDKSVSVAMSLLGLQHIMNYKACLIDLKRIIAKEMLHISSFCHKQDKINLFVLKSKKLVDMWLEDKFSKTLSDYNIAYDVLYSTKAFAKGIRKEKDISYVGSDRFPIVDTTIYYTVAKLK